MSRYYAGPASGHERGCEAAVVAGDDDGSRCGDNSRARPSGLPGCRPNDPSCQDLVFTVARSRPRSRPLAPVVCEIAGHLEPLSCRSRRRPPDKHVVVMLP
ncbi:hypothetical protein MRX96_001388 [Rhipicephalus microplus]